MVYGCGSARGFVEGDQRPHIIHCAEAMGVFARAWHSADYSTDWENAVRWVRGSSTLKGCHCSTLFACLGMMFLQLSSTVRICERYSEITLFEVSITINYLLKMMTGLPSICKSYVSTLTLIDSRTFERLPLCAICYPIAYSAKY